MADADFKTALSEGWARLVETVPDFRSRDGQRQMVAAAAKAFMEGPQGENISIVEAGTGTGKTFAYLVPGIIAAQKFNKKLVVSTATVTLQDQLLRKDLPLIQKALPEFNFAIAKGRWRYGCILKIERLVGEVAQADFFEGSSIDLERIRRLQDSLVNGSWNGDRDVLPEHVPSVEWRAMAADDGSCMRRKCRHYDDCPYYQARAKQAEAQVIVANHDLVLSSLRYGSRYLPAPEETLYVFDEAHHLPEKAIEASRQVTQIRRSIDLLQRIPEVLRFCGADKTVIEKAQAFVEEACYALMSAIQWIDALFENPDTNPEVRRLDTFAALFPLNGPLTLKGFPGDEVIGPVGYLFDYLIARKTAVSSDLEKVDRRKLATAMLYEARLSMLGDTINNLDGLSKTWKTFIGGTDAPCARWVERRQSYRGLPDGTLEYQVVVSPVDAGSLLRELVWKRAHAAFLASATLAVGGRFKIMLSRLGLPSSTKSMTIRSPFDYGRSRLVIPRMKSSPKDHLAHTKEIAAALPRMLSVVQGSLVVFASDRQMKDVLSLLPIDLRKIVLSQGVMPQREILKRHRERIAKGAKSAIFGLASFAEGVDLPGALCELVVVAKLSFPVPTEPYTCAREQWVKARGGNAFIECYVPETSIRLAQTVGRLIRNESDSGQVVVFDPRLCETNYGKEMLKGLPFADFSRTL